MKYLFWAILSMMVLLLMSVSIKASAAEVDQFELPYPAVLKCWQIDNAKMVKGYMAKLKRGSYYIMEIDTNNDGVRDGMLLYPILSSNEKDFTLEIAAEPEMIVRDADYDGQPDIAYLDRQRLGKCSTLKQLLLSEVLRDHKSL